MSDYPPISDYPMQVGDRVEHIKDPSWQGKITHIDWNLIHLGYETSTCLVIWDDIPDDTEGDIQWLNKLAKI